MPRTVTDVEPPRWLIGTEAAPYARVHPSTLYRWIKDGRIPAHKVGGRWYVRVEDLEAVLAGER